MPPQEQPAPGTAQIVSAVQERQQCLEQADELMAAATGTAHDKDDTIEATVDARGKLVDLTLAPAAVDWGPERLGSLLVEVCEVAMREATQNGYNQVALRLGEDMMYLVEQVSGVPAPARQQRDGSGITREEFQRRRDERLRETAWQDPAAEQQTQDDAHDADDVDVTTFDPATLRSDR